MNLYLAWDGDHIGRQVGKLALQDDEEGLRRVSQSIEAGNRIWASWVTSSLGELISYGGDEGRAKVPADQLEHLQSVRRRYEAAVGSPVSVGVGTRLSEADRALMVAKLRGGDQVVLYTPEIEAEFEHQQQRTEAEKLGDEYLKSERLWKADPLTPPEGTPAREAPENKPNAGGGFSGRHEPGTGGEPEPPMQEASEHSQGEAMQALADEQSTPETTHSSDDFEQALHDKAQEGEQDDQNAQAADQITQVKRKVVQILQQVRQQAPALEQIKQADPNLYAEIQGLVQALIMTAKVATAGQQQGDEQSPDEDPAPVQKAEPCVGAHFYGSKTPWHKCIRCGHPNPKHKLKKGERPQTVFRGMTAPEHDYIRDNGHILSNQRYCVPGEGTCFAADHDSAEDYVNFGHTNPISTQKPTYVMEVENRPDINQDRDGYWKTQKPVPAASIRSVSRYNPDGSFETGSWDPKAGFVSGGQPHPHPWRRDPRQWGIRKSIKDIQPGQQNAEEPQEYDYGHLLPAEHRQAGYGLTLTDTGSDLLPAATHNGQTIGSVRAWMAPVDGGKAVRFTDSHLDIRHRGKGIGSAMYEAAMAHGHHVHGATHVSGSGHSDDARAVHERLAAKHGMRYVPGEPGYAGADNGPYEYVIKDEMDPSLKKVRLPAVKPAPTHQHLNLPVGSTREGKVKVRHEDGHSSWVSVRAGQVLSNDGHAVSSRNPGGK
jgi:hypothetical protein